MNDTIIYILLFIAAILYAWLLSTPKGKHFANDYTWVTVVVGATLVLIALFFIMPVSEWRKVLFAFFAAGVPMIGRSLLKKRK